MGGMGGGPGSSPLSMGEAGNLVKELVETERKYVQELEVLHVRPLLTLGCFFFLIWLIGSFVYSFIHSFIHKAILEIFIGERDDLARYRPPHLLQPSRSA